MPSPITATYVRVMRKVLAALGWLAGLYLVVRGIAEVFVLDWGNPASYQDDWGGPSLAGVLAVHSGPGLVAAAIMIAVILRRRAQSRGTSPR
jgi:hypothetical protein